MTKGLGIASHLFKEYGPHKGEIPSRDRGVLVAMEGGISTAYSLDTIQVRGRLFIGAQEEIYEGMIIGENARPDDLPVNPCKAKKLNNMRSQGDGKGVCPGPAAGDDAGTFDRIHRAGRVRGSHAQVAAAAQEDPRRGPAQAHGEHGERQGVEDGLRPRQEGWAGAQPSFCVRFKAGPATPDHPPSNVVPGRPAERTATRPASRPPGRPAGCSAPSGPA